MRRTSAVMLALAAALARPVAAAPEEPAVVAGLVRNAWYWQARAREDKSEEAWRHVLEAAPDHPEALAALGGFHARAGRVQQAREALAKLEKVTPGHPDVPVLRRQIQLGTRVGPQLAKARRLVHEGHPEEGAAQYRELFGESGPPGDLALEYYQTVGGTPGGWEQARDGLRRLTWRAPAEARYRLELGKLLSYRGETRREGIAILSALARDRAVGKEATTAWRQALLWVNPATDMPLLRAYARGHPADEEIARRIQHGRTTSSIGDGYAALKRGDLREAERLFLQAGDDPDAKRGLEILAERRRAAARKEGFAALERGDLREAESRFLAAGDDADARLGLALVAQRGALSAQRAGDLPRARELLERVRRLAPAKPELWREALRDVTFWQLVEEARAARAAGRVGEAEGRLRAALEAAPERDRWHAELELANLELARRDGHAAEQHYREVLAAVPEQADALRALAGLLVEDGRFEEALPVNERLARVAPEKAFRSGWLRAEDGRARARKTRAAGDLVRARAELEAARQADGSDVWVLHDLANVLLELRLPVAARPVVSDLLRAAPALPEAQAVEARLLVAEGRDPEALEALSRIDPPPRDPATVALRRRLEVMVQVPALAQQAAGGGRSAAVQSLAALEARVKDEPELAARVAVGWSKLGENERALALMRTAVARAPAKTASMRLELASALLQAGDDAGVGELLRGLERDPTLGGPERRWLGDLRVAHAVRAADQAGEAGQPGTALAVLGPVLREYPVDPRLQAALGRALERRGDAGAARAAFGRALAVRPDDLEARRGAVDTALAEGDVAAARRLVEEGLRRQPGEPLAHLLAARVALAARDDGAAVSAYRRAGALLYRATATGVQMQAGIPGTALAIAPGRAVALPAEGAPQPAALVAVDPVAAAGMRAEIGRGLEAVRERHRASLLGGFEARQRGGEPGLSELLELRQSGSAEVPVGYRGRATFQFAEVELMAGALSASATPRLGTGTEAAGQPAAFVTGTELRLRYEGRNLSADVGSTPLGFPVQALLGGLRLHGSAGPVTLAAEGGRRSVTDSVLSYAGVRDLGTGRTWGGVVTEGGRLELGLALEGFSLFTYGSLHRVVGFRVADNQRLGGGGGVDVRLLRGAFGDLSAGMAGAALGYDKNLRYFTLGHGGYFSPQRFLHGGLPLRWARAGAVHWEVVAEPGLDTYEEASAPVFPLGGGAGDQADYPGRTNRGFAFNGRAELGFQVGGFQAALSGGVIRAPQFQEVRGGIVLGYGFAGPSAATGR